MTAILTLPSGAGGTRFTSTRMSSACSTPFRSGPGTTRTLSPRPWPGVTFGTGMGQRRRNRERRRQPEAVPRITHPFSGFLGHCGEFQSGPALELQLRPAHRLCLAPRCAASGQQQRRIPLCLLRVSRPRVTNWTNSDANYAFYNSTPSGIAGRNSENPGIELWVSPSLFADRLTFSAMIPSGTRASLKVFSASGRLVSTVAGGAGCRRPLPYLPAGNSLTRGAYFITLTCSNGTVLRRKAIRIR